MILTIDIGNTCSNYGLFRDDNLIKTFVFETHKINIYKSLYKQLTAIYEFIKHNKDLKTNDLKGICISCVVLDIDKAFHVVANELFPNLKVVRCSTKNAKNLDKNIYDYDFPNPEEVGDDFVAACVAANALNLNPCLIFDYGTATNVSIVDKDHKFIGGIIAPGVKTSIQSLFSNASALNCVDIKPPKSVIGKDTVSSLYSGVIIGEAARCDGLISRIDEELGYKTNVVITGGFANLVYKFIEHNVIINPNLLMYGLKTFFENYC